MKNYTSLKKLFFLVAWLLFFSLGGCSDSSTNSGPDYDPPADHTKSEDGFLHKPGLKDPLQNCVSCHGDDLRGGTTDVSCFECHGKKW